MERVRGELLERAGFDLPTLLGDYPFVRTGDQVALIFCNGWTEPHDLPDRRRTILSGATLEVTPDPFSGARVHLKVPAKRLPARTFASPEDLCAALAEAPVELLEGDCVGTP